MRLAAFVDRVAPQLWQHVDRDRLIDELSSCIGLDRFDGSAKYAPDAHVGSREIFRDPCLGTPGAGNHFVELQVVDAVFDRHAAYRAGLAKDDVVVMIHSGSRDVGFYVGRRWMDRARAAWPAGVRHPESGLYGLSGELAREYLVAMGTAARYAWLNRVVLAEMVRKELADLTGETRSALVVDVPHNVVLRETDEHSSQGATPARDGDLALIPGSMGDASFLATEPVIPTGCGHAATVPAAACAGKRCGMRTEQAPGTWRCVTLRDERRIEEAPEAYKPIGPVIDAQEQAGLIRSAVRLKPWITFKA